METLGAHRRARSKVVPMPVKPRISNASPHFMVGGVGLSPLNLVFVSRKKANEE